MLRTRLTLTLAVTTILAASTTLALSEPSTAATSTATRPAVTITPHDPVDLGATFYPQAVNASDQVAGYDTSTISPLRWSNGTVQTLALPAWVEQADNGNFDGVTGMADDGTVVANAHVAQGQDPHLNDTEPDGNGGSTTTHPEGDIGLVWQGSSTTPHEVDGPSQGVARYHPDFPEAHLAGITPDGTIAVNTTIFPTPQDDGMGNSSIGQVYNESTLTQPDGEVIKTLPRGDLSQWFDRVTGDYTLINRCNDTNYPKTQYCGTYSGATQLRAPIPDLTESQMPGAAIALGDDGTVGTILQDGYEEVLPDGTTRQLAGFPGLIVDQHEAFIVTGRGEGGIRAPGAHRSTATGNGPEESLLLDTCSVPLDSLLPADSNWSNLGVTAVNARGDLVGRGQLDGATHGFLLRPSVSCGGATPTPTPTPKPTADLSVALKAPAKAKHNKLFALTVTTRDVGPAAATARTRLTLPTGVKVVKKGGAQVKGRTLTWTSKLTHGKSAKHTIKVEASKKGKKKLKAAASSAVHDPQPANNKTSRSVRVI